MTRPYDYTSDFEGAKVVAIIQRPPDRPWPWIIIKTESNRLIAVEISSCKTLVDGIDIQSEVK